MAVVPTINPPEQANVTTPALDEWNERRSNGLRDRKRHEPAWHLCQSFLANKQWVGWSTRDKRVVSLLNSPDEEMREHHTENIITQYAWAIAGKLYADDYRPDVLFRNEDVESQKFAKQGQRGMEYAWDEELDADRRLFEIILKVVALGTAAGRVLYNKYEGQVIGDFPIVEGKVVTDVERARQVVAEAHANGQYLETETIREGMLALEPLSPFHMVTPPAIEQMRDFPWLIIDRPVPVDTIERVFNVKVPEMDLAAVDQLGLREFDDQMLNVSAPARLKGHVLLSTGYEMPSSKHTEGRTVLWAGDKPLIEYDKLPCSVNGRPHVGVVPFHFHRVPGRFWSLGVVEPLIGVQRQRNRARSQQIEMKDRMGLGRIFAWEDAITEINRPKGRIGEVINVQRGLPIGQAIQESPGVAPGGWLAAEVDMLDRAADKVAGVGDVSLGNSPNSAAAYATLALLAEQDDRRLGPIMGEFRSGVREIVHITLDHMRRYWGPRKTIVIAGENNTLDAFVFNAAKLPSWVYVKVGKGAPKPESPAAEVQKVFDIFDRSVSSGQPLPLEWLVDSLTAGKALPLPTSIASLQRDKAQYENLMILHGLVPSIAPYDNDDLHIQEHQQLVLGHDEAGDPSVVARAQQHIQAHEQNKVAKVTQATTAPNMQGPMGGLGGNSKPPSGGDIAQSQQVAGPQPQ
jgi:hypothetical protein